MIASGHPLAIIALTKKYRKLDHARLKFAVLVAFVNCRTKQPFYLQIAAIARHSGGQNRIDWAIKTLVDPDAELADICLLAQRLEHYCYGLNRWELARVLFSEPNRAAGDLADAYNCRRSL